MGRRTLALAVVLAAAAPAQASGQAVRQVGNGDGQDLGRAQALLAPVAEAGRTGSLLALEAWQSGQGGGFYGLLPPPVARPLAGLSVPDAARALVESRRASLAALAAIGYPLDFKGARIPDAPASARPGMEIRLDFSALTGFLEAMEDGVVSPAEATALAALPSNREMLRHRRDLGYVPEPLPTETSLARMIARAGSGDPVDRLWCWLSPANFFGYADLVEQFDGYRALVAELDARGCQVEVAAVGRIAPYLPDGFSFSERFALTVGPLIRGWATAEMSGLNVEQLKDDWPRLLRTLGEEVYHRLQLRLLPHPSGAAAHDFSDLVPSTGDPRRNKVYEALLYTVLEGTANLAAGPAPGVDDPERATEGAAVLGRIVEAATVRGDLADADALISKGLKSNGPLYALGYALARTVADAEGPGAVPRLLGRGPVALALAAQRLAPPGTAPLGPALARTLAELEATEPDAS